jgi:hypothetical protein
VYSRQVVSGKTISGSDGTMQLPCSTCVPLRLVISRRWRLQPGLNVLEYSRPHNVSLPLLLFLLLGILRSRMYSAVIPITCTTAPDDDRLALGQASLNLGLCLLGPPSFLTLCLRTCCTVDKVAGTTSASPAKGRDARWGRICHQLIAGLLGFKVLHRAIQHAVIVPIRLCLEPTSERVLLAASISFSVMKFPAPPRPTRR